MKSKTLKTIIKSFCLLLVLAFYTFCNNQNHQNSKDVFVVYQTRDKQIINEAIQAHGHHLIKGKKISFQFRNMHYSAEIFDSTFVYTRSFETDSNYITDVLSNQNFFRLANSDTVRLTQEKQKAYSASVNSVWYFVLLPLKLSDIAVNSSYIGFDTIDNQLYNKIFISFDQEGGGDDFEDQFCYWFNTKTKMMDFLAYNYSDEHGKGVRFRKAINRKTIKGIVFQDYINYKTDSVNIELPQLLKQFKWDRLDSLSLIENKNIAVESLN